MGGFIDVTFCDIIYAGGEENGEARKNRLYCL